MTENSPKKEVWDWAYKEWEKLDWQHELAGENFDIKAYRTILLHCWSAFNTAFEQVKDNLGAPSGPTELRNVIGTKQGLFSNKVEYIAPSRVIKTHLYDAAKTLSQEQRTLINEFEKKWEVCLSSVFVKSGDIEWRFESEYLLDIMGVLRAPDLVNVLDGASMRGTETLGSDDLAIVCIPMAEEEATILKDIKNLKRQFEQRKERAVKDWTKLRNILMGNDDKLKKMLIEKYNGDFNNLILCEVDHQIFGSRESFDPFIAELIAIFLKNRKDFCSFNSEFEKKSDKEIRNIMREELVGVFQYIRVKIRGNKARRVFSLDQATPKKGHLKAIKLWNQSAGRASMADLLQKEGQELSKVSDETTKLFLFLDPNEVAKGKEKGWGKGSDRAKPGRKKAS